MNIAAPLWIYYRFLIELYAFPILVFGCVVQEARISLLQTIPNIYFKSYSLFVYYFPVFIGYSIKPTDNFVYLFIRDCYLKFDLFALYGRRKWRFLFMEFEVCLYFLNCADSFLQDIRVDSEILILHFFKKCFRFRLIDQFIFHCS